MTTTDSPTPQVITQDGTPVAPKPESAATSDVAPVALSDRELARRVAEANYFASLAKDAEQLVRAEVLRRMQADYTANGNASRKILTDDGRLIGAATLVINKDAIEVTSETALTDFLQMEYEDAAVETRVVIIDGFRDSYLKRGVLAQRNVAIVSATRQVIEDATVADGKVIDPTTGAVIEGTEVLPHAVVDPRVGKVVPGMGVKLAPATPSSFKVSFEPRPRGAKTGGGKDLIAESLAGRLAAEFTPQNILEAPAAGGAQ